MISGLNNSSHWDKRVIQFNTCRNSLNQAVTKFSVSVDVVQLNGIPPYHSVELSTRFNLLN